MKVGDLVRVKTEHWAERGQFGILIATIFPGSKTNSGKAWKVFFTSGKIKSKLTSTLEVISEIE